LSIKWIGEKSGYQQNGPKIIIIKKKIKLKTTPLLLFSTLCNLIQKYGNFLKEISESGSNSKFKKKKKKKKKKKNLIF
jgi:hypothetical protein